MPTIVATLQQYSERFPDWLRQPSPRFDRERFFGSRTVYYPGYENDGHPVEVCAQAHVAHAFVYVDYGVSEQTVKDHVNRIGDRGFLGYEVEHEEEVAESVLRPRGWVPHVEQGELSNAVSRYSAEIEPFGWYVVLKRDEDRGTAHGPERLAMLFIGGDGFATYDALYCQGDGTPSPFLAILQDHGFGGNWDRFCADGLLERIASRCDVYPKWLLVGQTGMQWEPWEGYVDAGAEPEPGGMHDTLRKLFRRILPT